ncbi:MAG: putative lipoprotein [Betaproteobacteria bacterium]|jgi:hypothetical protein|nr:putative lipoprotein [Betaproteobacteria bacterium]
MRARLLGIAAASVAALVLAGCGEKANVTVYKQGQYQGKPDNVPWQSEPFNNDKANWEKTIKARNNNQNEYLRTQQ